MADVIVFGSMIFAAVFALVWLLSPDVRVWLEQPKFQFRDATRRYDRDAGLRRLEDRCSRESREQI
jgi:hypothetical protein